MITPPAPQPWTYAMTASGSAWQFLQVAHKKGKKQKKRVI